MDAEEVPLRYKVVHRSQQQYWAGVVRPGWEKVKGDGLTGGAAADAWRRAAACEIWHS